MCLWCLRWGGDELMDDGSDLARWIRSWSRWVGLNYHGGSEAQMGMVLARDRLDIHLSR
jgi:hypothetical protein